MQGGEGVGTGEQAGWVVRRLQGCAAMQLACTALGITIKQCSQPTLLQRCRTCTSSAMGGDRQPSGVGTRPLLLLRIDLNGGGPWTWKGDLGGVLLPRTDM